MLMSKSTTRAKHVACEASSLTQWAFVHAPFSSKVREGILQSKILGSCKSPACSHPLICHSSYLFWPVPSSVLPSKVFKWSKAVLQCQPKTRCSHPEMQAGENPEGVQDLLFAVPKGRFSIQHHLSLLVGGRRRTAQFRAHLTLSAETQSG